jgi:hypothetical protein
MPPLVSQSTALFLCQLINLHGSRGGGLGWECNSVGVTVENVYSVYATVQQWVYINQPPLKKLEKQHLLFIAHRSWKACNINKMSAESAIFSKLLKVDTWYIWRKQYNHFFYMFAFSFYSCIGTSVYCQPKCIF